MKHIEIQMEVYAALGWCWHEVDIITPAFVRCKCGAEAFMNPCDSNTDLTTWEGFGKLFEAMKQRDDWWMFKLDVDIDNQNWDWIITPERFLLAVHEYLKGDRG